VRKYVNKKQLEATLKTKRSFGSFRNIQNFNETPAGSYTSPKELENSEIKNGM
jgi:hypothetical protein